MARKATVVAVKPAAQVNLALTQVEARALLKAAETGLAVVEALRMVQNTATMEEAIRKLRTAL